MQHQSLTLLVIIVAFQLNCLTHAFFEKKNQLKNAIIKPTQIPSWIQETVEDLGPQSIVTDPTYVGGQMVSHLGIGTWAWGDTLFWGYDKNSDKELEEVYKTCLNLGINMFDTAEVYGTGRSEILCGKFRKNTANEAFFATKFAPLPWRLGKESVVKACKASLQRMGLESMELYQLHWPALLWGQDCAFWEGLADCYEQGLVKAVGVSNYGPEAVTKIHKKLASKGIPLVSNQVQYSLLSRVQETNGLLKTCKALNVTVLAYSPLAQGILTGKYSKGARLPSGPRGFTFMSLVPRTKQLVAKLEEIAANNGKTPAQVALNWCICQGTIPIPGAKTVNQAKENAGALGWRLTTDELSALDSVSKTTNINLPLPLQNK